MTKIIGTLAAIFMKRPDIIFTRAYLPPEEEYGFFAEAGSTEVSNGLCWLAAVTGDEGYKTEIVDAHVLKLSNKELASIILKKNPMYLGISSDIINIFCVADLAKRIKLANPEIKIILGGPHVTAVPEETMKMFPEFDIAVLREGELTIVDLLNALKQKKSLANVNGIIYRLGKNNEKLKRTKPREFIKNLDSLPLPAWDLLPNLKKFYQPPIHGMHRETSALLITSRGCPNQCAFCDRAVFGNVCRFHSTEYVMKMIRELHYRYGVNHFRINDDNFMLFKKRLIEICNKLIEEKLGITWSCFARVDSINPGILGLMKKAGCWQISFGIESGEQKILDIQKKGTTLDQIARAVRWTRKAGIRVVGFNIIGHPLETEKTMQKTIDFNKKIKVDNFLTYFMSPFPGTELYDMADKYGVLDRDWKKMGILKEPCFIPHGLTKEQIIKYQKKAFWQFYLQPRIIFSYLKSIKSLKDLIYFTRCVFSVVLKLSSKRKRGKNPKKAPNY